MDASGLIATTALNTTAQTALAAGTYASAEVDVLKITALQESAGSYTGLPATNITAQGKFVSQPVSRGRAFESPGFVVGDTGNLSCQAISTVISPGVYASITGGQITATQIISPILSNASNTFLTDSLGNCTVNQLTYTSLNPPLPAEVIPTLSQVLTAGSDAGNQPITNVEIIRVNNLVGSYRSETEECGILKLNRSGYHLITGVSNGLNVNSNLVIPSLTIGDSIGSYAEIASTGALSCGTVNNVEVRFKPTYDYYVAKAGSDTSEYGTILSPYLTIQRAITECEAQIDGMSRVIHVSAGSFTETLSISKSRISIKGEGVGSHPDTGSAIYGNINILLMSGNSDLNNNNITISGFLIAGTIDDSTTDDRPHRLIVDSCHIYGNDRCIYTHPIYDYRVFVSNCVISNDSLTSIYPLVQCSGVGMVSFTQNQMTAKGASQMVFKLSSNCKIDLFAQNVLTSASIGTNVAVAIFNHNSSQTITLGQNAFVYSSADAKRNLETAAGVFLNSTGSLVLLSNTFSLSGLASSQMAVYATSLSFPSTIIIYGNNISTSTPLGLTATAISGSQGTTKVATLSVQ
jgi:hypothetical protein